MHKQDSRTFMAVKSVLKRMLEMRIAVDNLVA
jgi:hypothetical protein